MGDVGDYWNDVKPYLKQRSIEKRAANRESSAALLTRAGITFESKNEGAHLIVAGRFDFWPGTGLWQERGTTKRGRGVRSLMRRLGGSHDEGAVVACACNGACKATGVCPYNGLRVGGSHGK